MLALYVAIITLTLTHEQRFLMCFSKETIKRNVHYCHKRITFMPQISGKQDLVILAPV